MLKDRDLEARPDHKRFPQSICFADPDGTRVAFGLFDESGPGAPLDITLEPGRTVRIPIEFETVRPSADAQGFLNVFIQPRRDIPEYALPVLGKRLGPAELTGSGHVTLRLPAGEYLLAANCFTKESRRLGKAEGKLVVPRGDDPLDARALRVRSASAPEDGRQACAGDRRHRPRYRQACPAGGLPRQGGGPRLLGILVRPVHRLDAAPGGPPPQVRRPAGGGGCAS